MHYIISYGDLEQHSEGGELRVLSDFAQSWKVLQAGGLLLPDLMEFYRWLHTELGSFSMCLANCLFNNNLITISTVLFTCICNNN